MIIGMAVQAGMGTDARTIEQCIEMLQASTLYDEIIYLTRMELHSSKDIKQSCHSKNILICGHYKD